MERTFWNKKDSGEDIQEDRFLVGKRMSKFTYWWAFYIMKIK